MTTVKDVTGESTPLKRDGETPKGLLRLIYLRELADQITSLRFLLSFLVIVALMGLSGIIYSMKYRTEVQEYRTAVTRYENDLNNRPLGELTEFHHPALKLPWKLAFLADGGQTQYPNDYGQAVSAWVAPVMSNNHTLNYRMRPLEAIDWTFIVKIILSLVAFVIAYDAICGEKQRGTLRLTMSYAVSRWQLLAGKFLSAWTLVILPFLVGALLNLIILTSFGGVQFSREDIIKVLLVSLWTVVACALFVLIALTVSAMTHKATTSLVVLLLLWVSFVVAIPTASSMLSYKLRPIPSPDDVEKQLRGMREEMLKSYRGFRPPPMATRDNFAQERLSAEADTQLYARQEALRRDVLRKKFGQLEVTRTLSSISPMSLFQYGSERLTGSGLERDQRFLNQAWAFRTQLEDYFRTTDAKDPMSPHIAFFRDYMSNIEVDPQAVPKFQFQENSASDGVKDALWVLLILGLETALAAVAVSFAFFRYDVR